MKRHKIQDGGTLVIWDSKWQRFVACSFFVNTEIIVLRFQQIFSLDYFLDYFSINLMVTCSNSDGTFKTDVCLLTHPLRESRLRFDVAL